MVQIASEGTAMRSLGREQNPVRASREWSGYRTRGQGILAEERSIRYPPQLEDRQLWATR